MAAVTLERTRKMAAATASRRGRRMREASMALAPRRRIDREFGPPFVRMGRPSYGGFRLLWVVDVPGHFAVSPGNPCGRPIRFVAAAWTRSVSTASEADLPQFIFAFD